MCSPESGDPVAQVMFSLLTPSMLQPAFESKSSMPPVSELGLPQKISSPPAGSTKCRSTSVGVSQDRLT